MDIICKNCGHDIKEHSSDNGCWKLRAEKKDIFVCSCELNYFQVAEIFVTEQQARLDTLIAENEKLFEVNSRTWCAYCKKEYPRTEDAMEQIREHISICEKHPMQQVEAERDALKEIEKDFRWLLSMIENLDLIDLGPIRANKVREMLVKYVG